MNGRQGGHSRRKQIIMASTKEFKNGKVVTTYYLWDIYHSYFGNNPNTPSLGVSSVQAYAAQCMNLHITSIQANVILMGRLEELGITNDGAFWTQYQNKMKRTPVGKHTVETAPA